MIVKRTSKCVPVQFDRGTRILRVISRAGRPCHFFKVRTGAREGKPFETVSDYWISISPG
jgi:hypothetical protein